MAGRIDYDKIAKVLGAKRRGKVMVTGGPFGALQLAADVAARFRVPEGGGRPTDPAWTERRLVAFKPATLKLLEALAKKVREGRSQAVEPLQLAAVLLERSLAGMTAEKARRLLQGERKRASSRRRAA